MSSGDMPELGSKISLISKADIRYEGKLYTVDPQDCTIALANVRSFGTEDRKTAHPVPAQNQVYDYILFRATDIKDISVVPPTQLLCDPAIVQLSSSMASRPPYGGGGGQPAAGGQEFGPMMSGLYQQGGGGGAGQTGGGGQSGGFNPMQSGLHPLAPPPRPAPQKNVLDFLTGSRSSTPAGPVLRKPSPTVDQGTQANTRPKEPRNNMMGNRNHQQDQRGEMHKGRMNQHHHQQQQQQPQGQQQLHQGHQGQQGQQNRPRFHQNQSRGWHQQGMMNHQPGLGRQQHQQQQQQQGGMGGMQPQRNNRGRGGSGGRQFTRAPGSRPKPQPTQPLKFESDYDFDKANSEFEELKSEISKLKINDGDSPAPLVNGDAVEKKEDSGNEAALSVEEQDDTVFYNKSKSFFDNISCEAIERSKGRSQRTDWRKERMLNSETFGVATARRNNYNRGRGGYYYNNRNPGGGFFQRNYRNHQMGGGQRYRAGKSPALPQPQPQAATA